jgi:glycine/D-amino acid oxidase-like deaminating enzyme
VASPALTWVAENCIEIKKMPGDLTGYTLTTAERQIHAEQVIIAAGASSLLPIKAEVELLARIPPLFCGAGAAIVCESARPTNLFKFALRTPNRAFACGLHAVPLDDRRVYIGATSNIRLGASAHPFLSDVGFLVECAVHQIDRRLASFNLTELRVGNRPVSLDGFPLVGQTSLPGLWIATGTYRDGFLLAPLIAQQVFDALLARHSVITGRELFAPERAPLQQGSKDEIIKVAIENYVAIALERRARFPAVGGWEDLFREQTSERVQETYRRIGSSYFAPPDFLWDIESDGLHDFFSEAYKTSETIWGVA